MSRNFVVHAIQEKGTSNNYFSVSSDLGNHYTRWDVVIRAPTSPQRWRALVESHSEIWRSRSSVLSAFQYLSRTNLVSDRCNQKTGKATFISGGLSEVWLDYKIGKAAFFIYKTQKYSQPGYRYIVFCNMQCLILKTSCCSLLRPREIN